MTKEYESNYDKVTEEWRNRFLAMDQENLIERFQLEHDADWIYLRYLDFAYIGRDSVCGQG